MFITYVQDYHITKCIVMLIELLCHVSDVSTTFVH